MTDVGLEEQFLLRVPPEVAKQIHHMMKDNDLDEVEFKFTDSRHGKFSVEGQEYKLTLVDLPCVVETHKTLDMRSYYKSGDIGQMLLVEEKKELEDKKEGDEPALPPKVYDHNYKLVDMGVTPATKNIRQRKFRKRPEVPREEVLAAEEELLRRMRGDAYAASENIEIVHESELLKEFGMPAQGDGEKKTPKKRKRKTDGEEGAEGESAEKPKKKRRKKGEAAADGAQAEGATGDGTAAGEEGKKPKKPRKKKEEKEGEPKEKKERKKKAPKAQATAPENASTVVAHSNNNTNAPTSAPEPMAIVQPVNPRVAELKEQLSRMQSDINALQKQVDGDIAAVPLEVNEVMRGRLEAKITRQQATINSKTAQMAAVQQELSTL